MKIVTATEMAIAVPDEDSLAAIRACIPNPSQFPYPTPRDVFDTFDYWQNTTGIIVPESTYQFITGAKRRGKGVSISSYPKLYEKAIVPLQNLWDLRDDTARIVDYLIKNPIFYKADKNPEDAVNTNEWVARCFVNLMEWLYLPSNPVYQYLREHLLEKARKLRKLCVELVQTKYMNVLPQRPTTSRSLGEDETPINQVNAAYKVVNTVDPFTGEPAQMLALVTWFYTSAHTEKKVYVDYFDYDPADIDKAFRKMRRSLMYYNWARNSSPAQYDALCVNFRQDDPDEDLFEGLQKL